MFVGVLGLEFGCPKTFIYHIAEQPTVISDFLINWLLDHDSVAFLTIISGKTDKMMLGMPFEISIGDSIKLDYVMFFTQTGNLSYTCEIPVIFKWILTKFLTVFNDYR